MYIFQRGHLLLCIVAGWFLLLPFVPSVYGDVDDAEYNGSDLNNGNNTITAGSHNLPSSGTLLFWDELPIGSEIVAAWTWHTQGNVLLNTQNGVPVLTDTVVNADPLTTNLYEGRTQVISIVTGGGTGDQHLGATGFNDNTGADLYFDADQGPPDHPDLEDGSISGITAANGTVTPDPTYGQNRAIIEFNASAATPFTIDLQGILRNIPDSVSNPVSPEVFGTVRADIVRIPGGSIDPQPSPVTTNTRPYPIEWPPTDLVTAPVWDFAVEGSWDMTFDFSTVQDGRYEIRLTAEDVVGNSSPSITDTTSTVLTVILDRGNPAIAYTAPPDPFIIGQSPATSPVYEDAFFTLVGYVDDLYSLPAEVDTTVRNNDNSWQQVFATIDTQPAPSGVFSQDMNFTSTGPGNIGANQPLPGEQFYWIVSSIGTDSSGNSTNSSAALNVIYDLAPPSQPEFSAPSLPTATTADFLNFTVRLDNQLPAPDEDLEEHGTIIFEMTVYPSLEPTRRTTFTFNGVPSGTAHSSTLDDGAVNTGPDPLGNIPDYFTGTQTLNLLGWDDGELTIELVAIDEVGNRSTHRSSDLYQRKGWS